MKYIFEIIETREYKIINIDESNGGDVLIIHVQVVANGIRNSFGIKGIKSNVGTFFGLDSRLSQPGDLDIDREKKLIEILKNKEYKTFYADPLVCDLAKKIDYFNLIPIPYFSVSSKLFKDAYKGFRICEF